jgi:type III restriction enzyme
MNRHVNAISGRLSLRPPQREALEILARVTEVVGLEKEPDLALALEVIRSEYPSVTEFEREFPSLCFALATGVGKTRLMGAFIAYLHLAKGVRHFFVLAPNLTIYNKLIADFTPGTPKYVLQGIAEFATNPPEVITGDNYESGRGIRRASLFGDDGIHINVFNISKINSEVRGGKAPRIKRLSEYIGESYFDYLAGLDDLVLLMDESHRYRASAGVRAINELRPVLGLELTATPQTESAGGPVPFKNVIYSYPLSQALADGFVKEPAVATRENFDAANYTDAQLERLKLEDGVRVHESVKVELEVYARQNDRPVVKPFMLVVAQDTEHANSLVSTIKDDDFFEGRYKERTITVHSNQRGEEADVTVERLLKVENPTEPTEIVVHVNMLKEGWDVTNLYTIVPLRAASSRTLVEQSIGRGLRLPYGRRVGVPAVDRLTIVAHDKFQAIIDEANNPDSIIRTGVVIGRDIAVERKETVVVQPEIARRIVRSDTSLGQETICFPTPAEQQVAQTTLEILKRYERLQRSADLKSAQVQAEIVREVRAAYVANGAGQGEFAEMTDAPDIPDVVARTVDLFIEMDANRWERDTAYEAHVSRGFTVPRPNTYSIAAGADVRNFIEPVEDRQYIRGMLFGRFRRCLYPVQRFDSDAERRFAVLLELEREELKWFKPARGDFRIYDHNDQAYEPDFCVETATNKYLCELKRASEMQDAEVQAKARAAVAWCEHATAHELAHGGKPWSYLLIPHDAISATKTLEGLAASYRC